jgi:hypothetical protein
MHWATLGTALGALLAPAKSVILIHRAMLVSLSRMPPLGAVLLALAASTGAASGSSGNKPPLTNAAGVQITQLADRLHVEINGQLFTEYCFTNVPRPYYYPLIGPGEAAMTRNWPMKRVPDEAHDHPYHRSLWFAHGLVNGHDFWSEATNSGRIVHTAFTEIKSGVKEGVIKSQDKWLATDGTTICTDERTLRIFNSGLGAERVFDFEITLHAEGGDLTLGDTKEGTMAVRVAETMRLSGKVAQGHIVNSTGARDAATWGKRADWCDYYGPVAGKTVGIAIFDHPQNLHHPTWWHVRDYGLFAANPFGRHDFEKLFLFTRSPENIKVNAGGSLTFRYRFYLHPGDDQQAKVAERYRDYLQEISRKL